MVKNKFTTLGNSPDFAAAKTRALRLRRAPLASVRGGRGGWTEARKISAPARSGARTASTPPRSTPGCGARSRAMPARSTVEQFKGGQSNPTYKLVTPGRSYVLRRKPPGRLLPGAHAVEREYRVITALGRQGFPVARSLRPVRGRERHRHALLCDGDGRRPDLLGADLPRSRRRRAPGLFRRDERDAGGAPQCRSGSRRARRLWQARQLFRPPDRPLVEAISGG